MQDDPDTETATEWDQEISGKKRNVYQAIFREMDDIVFLMDVEQTDADCTFTYRRSNASHQQQTGFSEDELRGQTTQELLGDEQGAIVEGNYRQCVEQQETIEYEERLDLPGGTSYWQTKLTPITDSGQVAQIVGVARDITEQKEQEQELEQIYRRFETVMETMSAAVFLKDTDGQYLMMNQACRELFNVEDQDIIGLTDDDIVPPDVAEEASEDDRRVIETGEMIEIEETVPTATGNTVRLTRKSPVYDDDDEIEAICGVSTDITEQKRREQEIQHLKNQFEFAIEGANIGIWDWEMTTDKVEFNERWAEMLGYSRDELKFSFDTWERLVHPDDLASVMDALEAHIDGNTEMYDHEIRMQTKEGDWKWILTAGRVVDRNEKGAATRAAGIRIDINDRKQAEQELKRQNSRLNEFANVVSHDLRNPLNIAQGRAAVLQQRDDDELEEHLSPILTALDRMESIIEDTLMLARQGETVGEMSAISAVELIGKCWAGVETAEATLELDDFTIHGDRDRLRHVFENLFRNAVEHGDEDVTVQVGRASENCIYVEDDGPGIPPSDRDKVLEPGHTSANGGTGFGLTIIKRIAEAHGWEITITDGRDGGARFEFDTAGLTDE